MKTEKIDMSLDEIIKTDKTTYKKKGDTGNKKPVGKGGARRTSARNAGPTGRPQRNQGQGQRNQQNTSPQKNRQNLKKSDGGKRPNTRPGLRPRKTGAAPPPAKNNKSITQKMAIQRLNKARATLQKAVQAVNMANKKLASTMPAEKSPKKKTTPAPSRRNSAGANNGRFNANRRTAGYNNRDNDRENISRQPSKRGRGGTRGRGGARGRGQQNNRVERRPNNAIQKRTQKPQQKSRNISNANVAIKIRNKGPSGRGRGKASVIRDTLKKEKPATSLDDRFSQLLKSAGRKANASRGRGGGAGRGRGAARGGRGRGGNSSRSRQRF